MLNWFNFGHDNQKLIQFEGEPYLGDSLKIPFNPFSLNLEYKDKS